MYIRVAYVEGGVHWGHVHWFSVHWEVVQVVYIDLVSIGGWGPLGLVCIEIGVHCVCCSLAVVNWVLCTLTEVLCALLPKGNSYECEK